MLTTQAPALVNSTPPPDSARLPSGSTSSCSERPPGGAWVRTGGGDGAALGCWCCQALCVCCGQDLPEWRLGLLCAPVAAAPCREGVSGPLEGAGAQRSACCCCWGAGSAALSMCTGMLGERWG